MEDVHHEASSLRNLLGQRFPPARDQEHRRILIVVIIKTVKQLGVVNGAALDGRPRRYSPEGRI